MAVQAGEAARQSARTSQLRRMPRGSLMPMVAISPVNGAEVENRAHKPWGVSINPETFNTSSATMAARAGQVARNRRSNHHSAGTSRPITIASAAPDNGAPSNIPSTRPGHSKATAASSDQAAVSTRPTLAR